MNILQKTLKEISQLTKTIETNYLEIYQFLAISPITISSECNPFINKKILQDYLDSLKQLLKYHLETRKKMIVVRLNFSIQTGRPDGVLII